MSEHRYPDPDYFGSVMNKFDGSHNAFTDQDATVYYNEIHHQGLEEGLDAFAQFFIAPTFNEKMTSKVFLRSARR